MKKKILLISTIVIASVITFYIAYMVLNPPFFAHFENAMVVQSYVESVVVIDESDVDEIIQIIQSGEFGTLGCYTFDNNIRGNINDVKRIGEDTISCFARKGEWGWLYNITFTFNNGTLVNVGVTDMYRGL